MRAHYFLGNRLLGSTERRQTWDGLSDSPCRAHFCRQCGDVWSRVLIEGGVSFADGNWLAVHAACSRHGGGSFLLPWNHHHLEELPDAVVEYEFSRILPLLPQPETPL